MKLLQTAIVSVLLLTLSVRGDCSEKFRQYFADTTFRFDYFHTGTKGEERSARTKCCSRENGRGVSRICLTR